ncbi:hypothetical protein FP744_10001521 [Trichoderma asperellum]
MPRGAGPRLRRKSPGNGPLHEDRVGRPMVRYLLDTYTMQQIQKLFEEEASADDDDGDDADSILPESEPKPKAVISSTACETITMPSSLNTVSRAFTPINNTSLSATAVERSLKDSDIAFSDNALAHQRTEEFMADQAALHPANDNAIEDSESLNIETPPRKQKEYTCGFCSEYGIHKRLSRPSDLKRHLENTHHTDNLWVCPKANCRRVFQWLGAFKEHARYYHKVRIRICDAEIITLCPQTVFACGFEGCNQLYEAPSDAEASPTKDKFIAHILGHFRSNVEKTRPWTFTLRMRNLLSQDGLSNVWPPPSLSYEQNLELNWDARSGSVLQKLLETRHLGSASSLIRNAIALGSMPLREVQLARGNAVLPILSQCQAAVHQIDMITVQATILPTEAANGIAESVNTNCSTSLLASDHTDSPGGAYQPQHLHQDAMQEILDSLNVPSVEQQYLSEDVTNPTEWIEHNGSEEVDDVV